MKNEFNQENNSEMAIRYFGDAKKIHQSLLGEFRAISFQDKLLVDRNDFLGLLEYLEKMKLLHSISTELLSEDNIQSLFEKFMDASLAIMDADFATIQLLVSTESGDKLHLLASRNFEADTVKTWEWIDSTAHTSCAEALHSGKRVLISDVENYPPIQGTIDLENYRRAGSCASQSTPLFSRNGNILGMISTHWKKPYHPSNNQFSMFDIVAREAADLIERKLTEEKLLQKQAELEKKCEQLTSLEQIAADANEAKSQFLANMSHEIRTPLNGIIGMADLLSMSELDDTQKKMVKAIRCSSLRLLDIIHDLLVLSKIDARKIELKPELIDFEAFINENFALFAPLIQKKGLEYQLNLESDVPKQIVVDKWRLSQIIANLVGNALKFTEKGKITVSVKKLKNLHDKVQILISISDTGVGIKKEDFPKIFDYFMQSDPSPSKKFQGTGLGLAIAKNFVNCLGGDICVESEYGKGSTFSFTFLAERAEREKNGEEVKPKILLVEDDYVSQTIIRYLCEHNGWDIEVASRGKQALEILEKEEKDIVLMDIQMPEMNGYEVAKKIRETIKGKRIPIIATTAYASEEAKKKCFDSGMDDFISKPIDVNKLKDVVLRWLSVSKSR